MIQNNNENAVVMNIPRYSCTAPGFCLFIAVSYRFDKVLCNLL